MRKVIVIVGQTATGKTTLAIKLAKKFNGEIISADSRQVYKGLDIGTGKISKKKMQGIPHYLIDVISPKKKFTVSEYKKLAEEKIKEITSRGRMPIICGGTGFYVDGVTKGIIFPEVPPNNPLRKLLEKKTAPELFGILEKLDKRRTKSIDKNNRVRLVRAIEIAKYLGKVPLFTKVKPRYDFIKIGIKMPETDLKRKIEKRVKKMFKKGLLNEIKRLKRAGITNKRLRELGFEYWNPTEESVVRGTWKYAKRQKTWFKRDKNIKWFSPTEYKKIEKYVHKKIL